MTFLSRAARCLPLVFLAFAACPIQADEPCLTCDEAEPAADAKSILERLGLEPAEYRVLMRWNEPARDGSGTAVTGYRLGGPEGRTPFDVYESASGAVLTENELRKLGLRPKRWDVAPMSAAGERSAFRGKAAATAPVKVLAPREAVPAIRLPELNAERLLAEDDARRDRRQKGGLRIGTSVELVDPVTLHGPAASIGQWAATADGGAVWAVSVESPEAVGIRIHFSVLDLPVGGRVTVYNTAVPTEAYAATSEDGKESWSATCFAETVSIECYVPAMELRRQVQLEVERIMHIYRPFDELPWSKAAAKSAGGCNLDVTCYPEWADVSHAVALITVVSGSSLFLCSGTLLVDLDPTTAVPYFLTATHCVADQSEASTAEVYWLYQTPVCNGMPPSINLVPRTEGGADLLVGTDYFFGTDMTLLRLRRTPPEGAHFAGWDATSPAAGQAVTSIHHPAGDFKRITFGVLDYMTPTRHGIYWSNGTTEPGSSGGPLLVNGTQRVVGTLSGGGASCLTPEEPDEYGRFDQTWALLAPYLFLDSDGDGLGDAEELDGRHGSATNPGNPDTDGDGLSDYQEVFGTAGYVTNPTLFDTDGDGLSDYMEIALGLDPLSTDGASAVPSLSVPGFTVAPEISGAD